MGENQEETEINYTRTLTLSLDENNRIVAKWIIDNEQGQTGTSFF